MIRFSKAQKNLNMHLPFKPKILSKVPSNLGERCNNSVTKYDFTIYMNFYYQPTMQMYAFEEGGVKSNLARI